MFATTSNRNDWTSSNWRSDRRRRAWRTKLRGMGRVHPRVHREVVQGRGQGMVQPPRPQDVDDFSKMKLLQWCGCAWKIHADVAETNAKSFW